MAEQTRNLTSAVKHSDFYDRFWPAIGREVGYHDELIRAYFIRDSIADFVGRSGLKILDLGCGRGWMAPFLQSLGTVIGIDFSLEGIRFAQENYSDFATFVLADASLPTLGLPRGGLFDVVVCSEVIEHVPDQMALLEQIAGFLHPGGWLMLTTPNGSVWSMWCEMNRGKNWQQPIENWVTPEQLKVLVKKAGFGIARHEGGNLVYRLPIRRGIRRLETVLRKAGLYRYYARLMLPYALYQMVAAKVPSRSPRIASNNDLVDD